MYRKEAHKNDGLPLTNITAPDLTLWDTTRYTDWQKELLGGTANITDVQTGISSGTKNTMFNMGVGYHRETLITPGDFGYQKATGSFSVNHVSSNQKFRAFASVNYGIDVSEMFRGEMVQAALTLPPNAPKLFNSDGSINWEIYTGDVNPRATFGNPMGATLNTTRGVNRNLIINTNLSYELMPGISLSTNLGLTDLAGSDKAKETIASKSPVYENGQRIPTTGGAQFADNKRTSWIIEPKASLIKQWGDHKVNALIGATWQQNVTSNRLTTGTKYISDALLGSIKGAGAVNIVEDPFTYKFASALARVGYNYKDLYLINLTGRRDGSSRFGPKNRFGNFWSLGGAWIFSNEKIFGGENAGQNPRILSFGKIRASYGITGSDNIGDYKYYNLYGPTPSTYQGVVGLTPQSLYNSEYKWEETRKLETAVEVSFFDNRISSEISWYRNRSSNQLVDYPLAATTGFDNVLQNFEATVQNTGLEFLLRGDVFSSDNWNWNASINVSLPKNKLLKFNGIENSPYATLYKVGKPVSIQSLYESRGVNPETGIYEFADRNNDGIVNYLDKYLVNPKDKSFYGGINNAIQFKRLELSFLIQFTRTKSAQYIPAYGATNLPVSFLNRWQRPGDITSVSRFYVNSLEGTLSYNPLTESDFNITDASFVRLKTLSLRYQLPAGQLERYGLRQAMVFLQGQNLFTLTHYKDVLDPETGNNLPPLLMLTLGFQLQF